MNADKIRVVAPADQSTMLDGLTLRERVLAEYPHLRVDWVPLNIKDNGYAVSLWAEPKPLANGEPPPPLGFDEMFLNPYTAEVMHTRTWGKLSEGVTNLIPFIYELHYQLALGELGALLMGVIAVLWTLDCFIGAYLTFPVKSKKSHTQPRLQRVRQWSKRWRKAWRVRWGGGSYKLNFDLHSAGGLWTWAMLFILAWSSVAFNLSSEVYKPVMGLMFDHQLTHNDLPKRDQTLETPQVEFAQARVLGQQYAKQHQGQVYSQINFESNMSYDPTRGIYRYRVNADADVSERWGATTFFIDAQTGELVRTYFPTGVANGDTVTTWITTLHMGALWGVPMQVFLLLMGVVVSILSITGVVIWWRKYQSRRRTALRLN